MANTGALLSQPKLGIAIKLCGQKVAVVPPTNVVYSFACNSEWVCAQWIVYMIFIKSYNILVFFF